MKRIFTVILLLLGFLFALPVSTHPAHASPGTGLVCLTQWTSNGCPQVPLTFNATGVGKTFTIGVFINNSDAMGGFDIYVRSDPSFVNPTSAALGTLIASPSLTSICVNGVATTGACTAVASPNGPGVVEVTTAESSGGNECGGISPCSGMAFTITYQVVGATSSTALSYPSGYGACTTSSVDSPPETCVLVDDAFGTTLTETTLEGDFTDQTPSANFAATPISGVAPLTVSFDAASSNATSGNIITSYNWAFGDGEAANVTAGPTTSHIYNNNGNFTPSLEIVDSAGLKSTIKDTLVIRAQCSFICANPTNLPILVGTSGSSNILLSGLDSFTGTISLTSQVSPTVTNGPVATLSPPTVIVSSGMTNTSLLTVSTIVSTPAGSYSVNVSGTSGTVHHSVIVSVTVSVPDFGISANPSSLTVSLGGNGISTITLNSIFRFNGTITLTATNSSNTVLGFPNPASIELTVAKGTNASSLYVIVLPGTPSGSYNIKVTGATVGVTGPLSHSFNVTVTVPSPNFAPSAAPTSLSIRAGADGISAITFTGLNGFSDTISLTANSSTTLGISNSFSLQSVKINATSGPVTSALTISTLATTPAGFYTITVGGSTTNIQHLVNITLTVVSPILPSIQVGSASLSTVSVTAGKSVTMTVTASNTGSIQANITVTMDVNSGTGTNITVAQDTVTLNPGQAAQTITLSWNTTQWSSGSYHVYARVIGSQTSTINQAQSAGTVALSSPPSAPPPADLSVIPWITTGLASAIAVVLGLLLFRRRRPTGLPESA